MKAFKKLQEEIQLVIAESKQKYVEVDTTRGIVQQFFFQMDKPSSKKVKGKIFSCFLIAQFLR